MAGYNLYGKTPSWFANQADILKKAGKSNLYEDVLKANNLGEFTPAVKAPTATSSTSKSFDDPANFKRDLAGFDAMPTSTSSQTQNNTNAINPYVMQDQNAFDLTNPSSWFSDPNMVQTNTLKPGYKMVNGQPIEMNQLERTQQAQEGMYNALAGDTGTSWNDWANIGLGALGTGMQLGLYGDRKDYLANSADALEQATQNSEEAHNRKMENNASYGSAFSS